MNIEELASQLESATNALNAKLAESAAMHQELSAKMGERGSLNTKLREDVDKTIVGLGEVRDVMTGIEQKMAALKVGAAPQEVKSVGQQLIESDSYKSRGNSRNFNIRMQVKAVTTTTAGGLLSQPKQDGLVSLARQRFVVRDLLPVIPVEDSSVEYATQTTRTNAGAPVAEGAAKPYSDYVWGSATAPIRTLAHLAKLTRQAVDDAPRLVGEVDSEMRYGLGLVEEAQVFYGNGTGQNLYGIIPQATAFAKPSSYQDTGATRLDVLRLALLQVALAKWPADGIVLSDTDWALIELTKATDGSFLMANPAGVTDGKRLWNLPVVVSSAIATDDFLVGAFGVGATIYDRMQTEVLISTENADDFEKNMATMRAEERIALAVKRSTAFVTGTLTAAIAAVKAP